MKIKKEICKYYNDIKLPEKEIVIPFTGLKKEKGNLFNKKAVIWISIAITLVIIIFILGSNTLVEEEKYVVSYIDPTTKDSDLAGLSEPLYYSTLIVKGTYLSVSETKNVDSDYYIFNILIEDVLRGDKKKGDIINIIGIKSDEYEVGSSSSESHSLIYSPAAFGYFAQLSFGDEILLYLDISEIKMNQNEEEYYELEDRVYYVNDDETVEGLLHPIAGNFSFITSENAKKWRQKFYHINLDDIKEQIKNFNDNKVSDADLHISYCV